MSSGKCLVLYLCLLLPVVSLAERKSCTFLWNKKPAYEISQQQVVDAFHQSFYDSSVYKPLYCDLNILRFYYTLKENYENLKSNDFNVYFFTTKYWVKYRDQEIKFLVSNQRQDPKNTKSPRGWNFHVVLEHKGVIYDFDYSNRPRPTGLKEYLKSFLVDQKVLTVSDGMYVGDHQKILIYKIPGKFFFEKNNHHVGYERFHGLIFDNFKPKTLKDFEL